MAGQAAERATSRPRGPRVLRFFYGAGLFAIGACLGVVIGSLSETPRLLLERLRGPVDTLDVSAPAPAEAEPAAATLERFGELQEGKRPAPAAKARKEAPAPTPEPSPPPVAAAAPVAKPATAAAPPQAAKPPASAAAAAPSPSLSARAVVQVASQIDRKAADELAGKLRAQGFDAYVSQPSSQNGRFRVRVRPEGQETPAALAKRLKAGGYDTWATSE